MTDRELLLSIQAQLVAQLVVVPVPPPVLPVPPPPTPTAGVVFRDTFTELVLPYKQLTSGHVPEVGLRWEEDEDTSGGRTPPFFLYTGDVPRGKVAVPSVNSYNHTDPRPDGTSWQPSYGMRRSFIAIPAVPLGPDYTVQFNFREMNNSSSKDFWYLMVRRTAKGTFYGSGWYYGSVNPDLFIFKVLGGVYTQLAAGNADIITDERTVALMVKGDTLTFKVDGVTKLTAQGGNAIPQAGLGGWGAGNIRIATDGFTEGESIDDFMITVP